MNKAKEIILVSHKLSPNIYIEKFKINKKLDFERGDVEYCLQLTLETRIQKTNTICKKKNIALDTKISQLIQSPNTYPIETLGILVTSHQQTDNSSTYK